MTEQNPFKEAEKKEEAANKDTFKNVVCYIPFGAIVMFFVEQNKSETLKRHISYGLILFFGYLIFSAILSFLHLPLGGLLEIAYVIVSFYLGFMAYHGKDVSIEQFDDIEKQIKNKM